MEQKLTISSKSATIWDP